MGIPQTRPVVEMGFVYSEGGVKETRHASLVSHKGIFKIVLIMQAGVADTNSTPV